jgi:hypothetical protein
METPTAHEILSTASALIHTRGGERDIDEGERSIVAAVAAFNALTGHCLSITQGWQFMVLLKQARAAAGAWRADDWIDLVAYAALAAEAAHQEYAPAQPPRAPTEPVLHWDI